MPNKKLTPEEQFIKKNHLEESYPLAKEKVPDLWHILQAIENHYSTYSEYCEAIVRQEVLEILNDSESKGIHSARFRVKKTNSLLVKIVKKVAFLSKESQNNYNIEKYRNINSGNYFKIITDLSGIRILIRYREQWVQVHNWIWERYFKGTAWYLRDFEKDYKYNTGNRFIAEKPKIYYRNQQDRDFYERLLRNEDIFDFIPSDVGYNSIHYLISVDGKYIEIQLRTILDEAWGECTHDIVYKGANNPQLPELQYLSKCLAQQTIAAEFITNLIYEKVNKKGTIYGEAKKSSSSKMTPAPQDLPGTNDTVEKRIQLLEKNASKEFDGTLDSLF